MAHRVGLRCFALALLATWCLFSLLHVQAQQCIDTQPAHNPAHEKITVVGVEFKGEDPLSDELRAQLVRDIQHSELLVTPDQDDSYWVFNLVEIPIKTALQNRGYFKCAVEGTPFLVRAGAHERRYVVRVAIESGAQYRLNDIRIQNAKLFSLTELRNLIPLHTGDIVDFSKVQFGMGSIHDLYASRGYIDTGMGLDSEINEEDSSLMDLVLTVWESDRQYHVGRVEILGLARSAKNLLMSQVEPGQVFDGVSFNGFFEENKSLLPSEVSLQDAIRVRRDLSDNTVEIVVDFRCCPSP